MQRIEVDDCKRKCQSSLTIHTREGLSIKMQLNVKKNVSYLAL